MAGKRPFFLTGATAIIKVNGLNLAFCTNVSYSVTVNHASPRILGMYEPTSIEPLSYLVTGSFSVVRYVADAQSKIGRTKINDTTDKGNGIGNWTQDGPKSFNLGSKDGKAHQSLNPKYLDKATGFQIEIYQDTPKGKIGVARIKEARITRADFNLATKTAATQNFQFTALYADEDSFLADFSGKGQQNQ